MIIQMGAHTIRCLFLSGKSMGDRTRLRRMNSFTRYVIGYLYLFQWRQINFKIEEFH